MVAITSNEKIKSPVPMDNWLNKTKSKNRIPTMSDTELSYIINSRSALPRFDDEGMATALLIIANGIEFNNEISKGKLNR
jgi:hypothetical protein